MTDYSAPTKAQLREFLERNPEMPHAIRNTTACVLANYYLHTYGMPSAVGGIWAELMGRGSVDIIHHTEWLRTFINRFDQLADNPSIYASEYRRSWEVLQELGEHLKDADDDE